MNKAKNIQHEFILLKFHLLLQINILRFTNMAVLIQ